MGNLLFYDLLVGLLVTSVIIWGVRRLVKRIIHRRIYNWQTVPKPKIPPKITQEQAAAKRRAFTLHDIAETRLQEQSEVKKK